MIGSKVWNERQNGLELYDFGSTLSFSDDSSGEEKMMGPGGSYVMPIRTKGVSRVDVKDSASAALNVAKEPEKWRRRKAIVGSRELCTVSSPGFEIISCAIVD